METSFTDHGYTEPRRRGTPTDPNRDARVVPYNRKLLLKFRCHINVEVAASVEILAYLYKYIYKGPDLAYFRSMGRIAIVCASTGIASIEYVDGVTAHSMFKIPV
jgi:hypothetical protein